MDNSPLGLSDPDGTEPNEEHARRVWQTAEEEANREPEERNYRQDKKISERRIEEMKKRKEFEPHEIKQHKESNLYYDPRTGKIYEKPEGGDGPGEDTGYNVNEF